MISPDEQVSYLDAGGDEHRLLVRHRAGGGPSVLYVHGATFPSALSVAYRIDGRSWIDDLCDRGFDVWAFDFAGFGGSARSAAMLDEDPRALPFGRAGAAAREIERVAGFVLDAARQKRLGVIAHSWGTLPAGMFAARRPGWVERLVLFGPIGRRSAAGRDEWPAGAYRRVTASDQWHGFQSGLPQGAPSLIAPEIFAAWATAYLATDPDAAATEPPSVRVPAGPQADIADAWAGRFPYHPSGIKAATLLVRGEWDDVSSADDVAWLRAAMTNAVSVTVTTLPRGGHRMHLEENRAAVFAAAGDFLVELDA
jgi:pimeloyl-ACP methyl ester carboxylesterase